MNARYYRFFPLLLLLISIACNPTPSAKAPYRLDRAAFQSTIDGKSTDLFTLKNGNGLTAKITNYGGRLVAMEVPDKSGNLVDVVLGYDDLESFKGSSFGAIIGRYANRIAGASFELEGKTYELAKNNKENHIHGGKKGFQDAVWDAEQPDDQTLVLTLHSPHMEEGYPGNLDLRVTYHLSEDNELKIDYAAISDQTTILNVTNHAYFNLNGEGSGSTNDHMLMINAHEFTAVNDALIPTGELRSVTRSPFDFRKPTPIGKRLNMADEQLLFGKGYDHNFVITTRPDPKYVHAATAWADQSAIVMKVLTTEPGLQLYGGNHLNDNKKGKGGKTYGKHSGFCLETQHFPNSPNQPDFPSTILAAGDTFRSTSIYQFSVQNLTDESQIPEGFTSLFNDEKFSGWYSFLDEEGLNQDPKHVFTMENDVLHVSGEQFGYLCTEKEYADFHFRVDFKWGNDRWAPRDARPRDSGICYFFPKESTDMIWPRSMECQIQEADCGDYWLIDSTTIEVKGIRNEPKNYTRFFKFRDAERPHGEWNTIEVIAQNGLCQHWVNGVLVNEGKNPNISQGKILLQSEGAEIFFRNAAIKEL